MSTLSTEEHNTDIRSEDRLANSFRDPAGCLFSLDGSIYRVVNPVGVADLDAFMASKAGHKLMNSGKIVGTRELDPAQRDTLCRDARVRHLFNAFGGQKILQHERVEFQTYPYEWPAEMLHAAGVLTLNLAAELVEDGLGLKDGTPYNVLFRGPDPVFIDVLSFERREADDPTWLPYAQFVRTFVLPLLAHKKFGVPLDQIFLARRDGLEPEDVYKMTGPLQRLLPPFLSLVSMPTWLAAKHNADDQTIYEKKGTGNPEKSRYILESLLNGLRGTLDSLKPVSGQNSTWSDYMGANNNYSQDHFAAKQKFVDEVTRELKPRRVLDIGCNTDHFSAIAARNGAGVVAADYDPVVAGEVWRKARAEKLNIQPMVINLTRPTPEPAGATANAAPSSTVAAAPSTACSCSPSSTTCWSPNACPWTKSSTRPPSSPATPSSSSSSPRMTPCSAASPAAATISMPASTPPSLKPPHGATSTSSARNIWRGQAVGCTCCARSKLPTPL